MLSLAIFRVNESSNGQCKRVHRKNAVNECVAVKLPVMFLSDFGRLNRTQQLRTAHASQNRHASLAKFNFGVKSVWIAAVGAGYAGIWSSGAVGVK